MSIIRLRPSTVEGRIPAPPSKSYTHRFVLAAHLSGRTASVRRPLVSDDTLRTARGVRSLGSRVEMRPSAWTVSPGDDRAPRGHRRVDCGQSGTTLRLLAASAALQAAPFRFVGSGRLPVRPMEPLLDALAHLGARVDRAKGRRALPFEVCGPMHGGTVDLAVDESSQFTSALLFALPTLKEGSRLRTRGKPVSEPYVRATLAVLHRHGIRVAVLPSGYRIPGGQRFRPRDDEVPGDASSAAYLWAAAALTGGNVSVGGVPSAWPQADLAILDLLERYGAEVARTGSRVTVRGGDRRPFRCELTDAPDLYPIAGVLAAAAPGRSELRGAAHVAAKESDRKVETAHLARAMGAKVRETASGLAIEGGPRCRALRWTTISDHRILMSAAVAALAADRPSELADASAVAKSFPGFFDALEGLGAEVALR